MSLVGKIHKIQQLTERGLRDFIFKNLHITKRVKNIFQKKNRNFFDKLMFELAVTGISSCREIYKGLL